MIGIAQNRDGKAKHGEAWKRRRQASQRAAAERQRKDLNRDERCSNGTAVLRYATEWHRIATTGPETEKQKYRAGRNPAERKII